MISQNVNKNPSFQRKSSYLIADLANCLLAINDFFCYNEPYFYINKLNLWNLCRFFMTKNIYMR